MLKYEGWVEKSHSLRKEAAVWSAGTAEDTSVSLARGQQSEQAVAGMGIVFQYSLKSAKAAQLTDITDAQ